MVEQLLIERMESLPPAGIPGSAAPCFKEDEWILITLGAVLGASPVSGRPSSSSESGHRPAQAVIQVPVSPASASGRRSMWVMSTRSPPPSRNRQAASIFGPMLPGGNCPAAR